MNLMPLLSRLAHQNLVAHSVIIATTALALLMSANAFALKSDRDKPADIEADDTTINFKTGQRTFIGNVIVVQGTLRIKADKVIANYKDGKLVNATAWGNLARFKSRPDGKPEDVEGLAKKIFVNQANNTLTLTTNATLKQGINTARGQEIIYNLANDTLKIQGGSKIGAGGNSGKVRPNRKLEDPFKDDPIPTANAKPHVKASKNTDDTQSGDSLPAEVETKPTVIEATPVGRSRLLIQPKPKSKPNTNGNEDSKTEKADDKK